MSQALLKHVYWAHTLSPFINEEAQEDEMIILGLSQASKQSQNLNLSRLSLVPHDRLWEAVVLNHVKLCPILCVLAQEELEILFCFRHGLMDPGLPQIHFCS